MQGFSMNEAESILRLPASTLRFWEKEVPFIAPRKDVFGRRVYTSLDLCILSRMKYLAQAKGLGLGNACAAMEKELTLADPDMKASINEMKTSFFSLAARLNALKKQTMEIS